MVLRSNSPYITPSGVDVYKTSNTTYWLTNIFVWIYAFLFLFWVVLLLLVHIPHTYFWNLLEPGRQLLSLRYRSLLSIALILSGLRFFVPILVRALLRFNKSKECGVAWLTLIGIITLVDFFVFLFIASQFANANNGDVYNLCNDPAYCCSFWNDPVCQRSGPCIIPGDGILQRNGLCDTMFYTSIPFLVFNLVLFLWPLTLWGSPPIMIPSESKKEEEDDDEDNIGTTIQRKYPNIRRRKYVSQRVKF